MLEIISISDNRKFFPTVPHEIPPQIAMTVMMKEATNSKHIAIVQMPVIMALIVERLNPVSDGGKLASNVFI